MESDLSNNSFGWSLKLKAVLSRVEMVEQGLVTLILTLIIVLATYQVGLRWFTSGGLPWIDPLLRYAVLWGGLLGAVLATARAQHISLDVVSYLIPERLKPWLKLITLCFSAVVAGFLFRAAVLFMQSEIEFGGTSLFGLPSWILYLIFPISFAMISVHFILSALLTVMDKRSTGQQSSSEKRV
jgi:TRAP-type C4-dicarboxylate transport system permease small subunit